MNRRFLASVSALGAAAIFAASLHEHHDHFEPSHFNPQTISPHAIAIGTANVWSHTAFNPETGWGPADNSALQG